IAQLNYFSGMLARAKNDFKSSLNFFATGIGALPDSAQTSQHPLPDQLAVELANAQYLCGDYLAAVASYDACIERTRDNDLMAEMVKSKVLCYQTVGMNEQALQAGINFLSTCQLHIPDVDDLATIEAMFDEGFKEYQRTVQTTGFNIGELSSHKTLSDPRVKRLTTVLSEMIYPAFFTSMELMSLITLLQVNLILKHGNSEQSPFIYAWWGTTLAYRKHYDEADQYAQLATAMSRSNLQIARAYTTSGIFVYPYSRPLKHAVAMLKVAATSAEQTNQVALASYSTTSHNRYAFHSGLELESLKNESESCLESIARLQVPPIYDFHNLMHHSYLSLLGLSEDKYVLHENAETQQALLDKWTTDKSRLHMELYTLQEMILHYLYGDYAEAAHFAKLAEENKQGMIPAYDVTRIPFYYALSLLALYPNASGDEQKKHQKIIKNCTLELKTLTTGCEENFSHEYSLINAEQARIDGNVAAAITLYSEAITSAKENNFLNIEAMANELFAKFWLGLDQKAYANIHLRESYYLYQRWGAVTKLQQMEEAYGAAIKSINNEAENKADDWSNRDIDFDSILKSSREISQVSSLPKLINTVIHIMVKHIGAHNCCFLLKLNDSFIPATQLIYDSHNSSDFVYHTSPEFAHEVALPVADDHQAGEQPSVDDIRVPNSIIDYVTRSAHSLILGDLAQHSEFNSDPYFAAKKVMSIICQPIINKGEVIAVLYFENNALSGAFTERHENILNALSLQISISL
ncbi:MAG: GAF domain-containing protein, partial [Bermanella sp.]